MQNKFSSDKHFEERICQGLIVDHAWAEQMLEVLDIEYFNLEYTKEVTRIMFEYYKKYSAFPSFNLLATIVKEMTDDVLKEKIIAYLIKIRKEPLNGDMDYVKEMALDFCKRRALAGALESSLDLIENKKYEQIIGTVQKALLAGSDRDVGHVYLDNLDKRMESIKRNPIPTPWKQLNNIMGGGLASGELGVIMGTTGQGKSHSIVDIAQHVACQGFNVALYTLELSDIYVGKRLDARVSGVPFDDLCAHKEGVKKAIQENIKGSIIIKSFPAKSITTLAIKNHINQLTLRDKRPHLIIIDSGDLLKSSRSYDQKRLEEESCYEEMRALAQELQLPIWSTCQSNREGLDVEVLTLKHVAESFGKAQISDFFLTMVRQKDNTHNSLGNFYVAKSRLGPDGMKFNILVNTALSKFEILEDKDIPAGSRMEELDAHELLRKRFRDMQKDGKI
jgi:replicative DNA helicase